MNADSTALITGILFNKKLYFPGIFSIYLVRYTVEGNFLQKESKKVLHQCHWSVGREG